MAFLDGIKQSLKLDEAAAGVASKLTSAKEFLQEKQQSVTDSVPVKMVKEKVGNLVPQGAGQYFRCVHVYQYREMKEFVPKQPGGGKKQSPIDVITSEARYDESLGDGQFQFNYVASDCVTFSNTGFSWFIQARNDAQSMHLPGTYQLRQIHGHWGTEPMNGSEHLVGGVGYAGEIHIVHWNTKYGTFEEALKQPDGVAVLGIFLNESHDDNRNLQPLVNLLDRLVYKGDSANLDHGFEIRGILPDKTEFWTYEGSLTTPPLAECVVWTVFRGSIPVSSGQLDKMRGLFAVPVEEIETNPQRIAGNIRPCQPLNGRLVRASFRSGGVIESS